MEWPQLRASRNTIIIIAHRPRLRGHEAPATIENIVTDSPSRDTHKHGSDRFS